MQLQLGGSQGVYVKAWQKFLSRRGFYSGRIDGIFGIMTKAATQSFQSSQGLVLAGASSGGGIVDPTTLAKAHSLGFLINLRNGNQGYDVQAWQTYLNQEGLNSGRADGIFGPTTTAATKVFQSIHGLISDGIVGPKTLAVAHMQGFMTLILTVGSRGTEVEAWQRFLNQHQGFEAGRADGIFGPMTKESTKAFQSTHGLLSDGIVGPLTVVQAQSLGFVLPTVEDGGGGNAFPFPPKGTWNVVIDISHYQNNVDFHQLKASGIRGVIAKSTEGYGYTDPTYKPRRSQALKAGLLWGAYHFGTGTPVAKQLEYFFRVVDPDPNTLLVLDWEDNPHGTQMSLRQAQQFVQGVHDRTNRWPVLYGGRLLKQQVKNIKNGRRGGDPVLRNCPLWLAEWSHDVTLPAGWSEYTLWQYTDGIKGPQPRGVQGVEGYVCDRSVFNTNMTRSRSSSTYVASTVSTVMDGMDPLDVFWKSGLWV